MRLLTATLVALCGCAPQTLGAEPAPAPDAKPGLLPMAPGARMTNTQGATTYDWTLTREGQKLKLDYWVKNGSDKILYVCDKLVTQGARPNTYAAVDRVTIQNTDKPDVIMFVAGTPATSVPTYRILPQVYRPLAPGEQTARSVVIPLPLKAWNPMGSEEPLGPKASKAVLLVFTFEGEPPTWRELPGDDGKTIKVPEGMQLKVLRAGPLPLP
jgi:hypothetical protein